MAIRGRPGVWAPAGLITLALALITVTLAARLG